MQTAYALSPAIHVHTHACGEDGIFVNAFLIESRSGVVAIDATLTMSTSKALRARLDALHKPLLAVLVTHPHPDHVAGLANLVTDDATPIYATTAAQALMRAFELPKRAQWTPVYGAEWVQQWRYPNRTIADGESLEFDGVRYTVHDLGPGGDSDANAIWVAEPQAPAAKPVAFLSDLIFHGIHSYLADGGVLAWLANLARVESLCKDCEVVFPGHGAAGPPQRLIDTQRAYLLQYVGRLQSLVGTGALTDEIRAALTRDMSAWLPGGGLEFLIGMSADKVLAELRGSTA
jgi:glyoxylase-like metal-dependent hydrolase (beta-lactamase superfamily II)